jgi:hypothetical protein
MIGGKYHGIKPNFQKVFNFVSTNVLNIKFIWRMIMKILFSRRANANTHTHNHTHTHTLTYTKHIHTHTHTHTNTHIHTMKLP